MSHIPGVHKSDCVLQPDTRMLQAGLTEGATPSPSEEVSGQRLKPVMPFLPRNSHLNDRVLLKDSAPFLANEGSECIYKK